MNKPTRRLGLLFFAGFVAGFASSTMLLLLRRSRSYREFIDTTDDLLDVMPKLESILGEEFSEIQDRLYAGKRTAAAKGNASRFRRTKESKPSGQPTRLSVAYDSLVHLPEASSHSSRGWRDMVQAVRVDVNDRWPYRAHFDGARRRVASVSVRGPGHFKAGLSCQDAHRCVALDDGTIIAAVADGVGSAALSDLGARLAIDAAVDYLREQIVECSQKRPEQIAAVMDDVLGIARLRIAGFARTSGQPVETLASTLLVAVVSRDGCSTAHAGDGAIVVLKDGCWTVASAPEDTPYANYVTPLACENGPPTWRRSEHSSVSAVALLTDGIERSGVRRAGSTYQANSEFFGPIHRALSGEATADAGAQKIAQTLDGLRMRASNDDDKTLVMVWTDA